MGSPSLGLGSHVMRGVMRALPQAPLWDSRTGPRVCSVCRIHPCISRTQVRDRPQRAGGREGGRGGGREGGREAGRQGGREGGREAGREGGREGGRGNDFRKGRQWGEERVEGGVRGESRGGGAGRWRKGGLLKEGVCVWDDRRDGDSESRVGGWALEGTLIS